MINYDAQGYVSSLVDGNGNTRTYTSDTGYNGNPNLIHVTLSNASVTAYTYSITYDANMSETSEMDGTGQVVYKAVYADPNDPYRPSAEYDGNAAAAFSSGVTGVPQGGSATLASYADHDGVFVMPQDHREFYDDLLYHYIEGDHVFVHAGLPANVEDLDIAVHGEEMVWMRHRPGSPEPNFSKIVVHGHSAIESIDIQPRRINLDTACVYGRRLTALEINTHEMFTVERSTAPQPIYLRDSKDSRRNALRFSGKVPVVIAHRGERLVFETINYSEIGMLMVPVDPSDVKISAGSSVIGTIGVGDVATSFKGVVLRVDGGQRIALKIVVEQAASP